MADFFVDNVNGNDGNSGASEALAKATLASAQTAAADNDTIYVQAGSSYVLTAAVAATKRIRWEGYTTTPGARDGRPTITSATNSVNLFEPNVSAVRFVHLNLTHTAATRGGGIVNTLGGGTSAPDLSVYDCILDGCLRAFDMYFGQPRLSVVGCNILNCTDASYAVGCDTFSAKFIGCRFKGNTGANIYAGYGDPTLAVDRCIFDGGARGIYYNFNSGFTAVDIEVTRSTFYNQTSDGICLKEATNGHRLTLIDNLFHNITGPAVVSDTATQAINDRRRIAVNNAFRSISGGHWSNFGAGENDITLSADAMTNPGSGDYSPNSTSGGGAELRAAGLYGADIGAVQSAAGGGGGGPVPRFGPYSDGPGFRGAAS